MTRAASGCRRIVRGEERAPRLLVADLLEIVVLADGARSGGGRPERALLEGVVKPALALLDRTDGEAMPRVP